MLAGDTFKLVVNTPSQESIFVDTSSTMRISELKQRISQQTRIAEDSITLMASGKELANENTVGDYDIQPQATIHMIVRLQGGHCLGK